MKSFRKFILLSSCFVALLSTSSAYAYSDCVGLVVSMQAQNDGGVYVQLQMPTLTRWFRLAAVSSASPYTTVFANYALGASLSGKPIRLRYNTATCTADNWTEDALFITFNYTAP